MYEPSSRYYRTKTTTYTTPSGDEIYHLQRRFLPRGEDQPLLVALSVAISDRLNLISYRTLGDPLAYWRICDANNALNPFDVLEETGEHLRITIPQVEAG